MKPGISTLTFIVNFLVNIFSAWFPALNKKARLPAITTDRGFINNQAAMLHSMAATETNNYEAENEWKNNIRGKEKTICQRINWELQS